MKIINIDGLVQFDNGTTITDYHRQDCCESVWADFRQLEDTNIFEREIHKIEIEGVKNLGFRLNGYFVPCYNEQNGYHNNELKLVITHPDGTKEEIDISDFTKYNPN